MNARATSGLKRAALPAFLALLLAAVAGWWILGTPRAALRDELRNITFWWLEIQLALVGTFAALAFREARGLLAAARRQYLVVLLAGALAFVLSSAVAPRTSRIFYDEQIYQGIGQNLADLRLAQMCNDGIVEYGRLQCRSGEYNKQPNAYPHLLSVLYRVGGVRPATAHWLNSVVSMLLVWAVFCVTVLLFRDPAAGCFAAVIMATIPMQIAWGNTAAVEPTAELAASLALLSAALHVRARTNTTLLLLATSTAYACGFRPESPLVIVPVALTVLLFAPGELARPRTWWALGLGVLLVAPLVAHVVIVSGETWGAREAKISLDYVAGNLHSNGWYYLWDGRFPVLYTLLAVGGVAWSLRRRAFRAASVLGVAFLAFAGTFLVFYAGSYDYGADVRYSLLTFPPISILGGVGAVHAARYTSALGWSGSRALSVLLFVNALWYLPLVRATGEEAWAARADVRFAERLRSELRGNSMVLTHNPSLFHVMGVNASQASLATTNPDQLERELFVRHPGRVYFHWNFWCNVADPVQVAFCHNVLDRFDANSVAEYRERDYRFGLYRLSRRVPASTTPCAGACTRSP